MQKVWKIGTNIYSYIQEWEQMVNDGWMVFSTSHDKNDLSTIIFSSQNGKQWRKKSSTASQILRVLLALGLIESVGREKFDKDKTVIADNTYQVSHLNNEEKLGDFLSQILTTKVEKVFGEMELLFPSEDRFLFSLLAVLFVEHDESNEKFIDQRILEDAKVDLIKVWYRSTVKIIEKGHWYQRLIDASRHFIIGMKTETQEIAQKINNVDSPIKENYYSPVNTSQQITSSPYTLGSFVKDFFSSKVEISIPIYQRKYIWPAHTVKVLLNDILNIPNHNMHYIGNIIIKSSHENSKITNRIIDGQQRITTLILILRALFDLSRAKSLPVDSMINQKYVYVDDMGSFINSFRRVEGNDDFDAFKQVLIGKGYQNKKLRSNILENYRVILDWMTQNLHTRDLIESYWDKVLNQVLLVLIDDKVSNEFKLFEKLNTGNVQLTTIELFKNFILEKFQEDGGGDEKVAQKHFETYIIKPFQDHAKIITPDIENFFITSIRSYVSALSNDTIFNQYKDLITTEYYMNRPDMSFDDILTHISRDINIYLQMSKYDLYKKSDSPFKDIADFLFMFDGRKVYYPVFLKLFRMHFKDINKPTLTEVNYVRKFLRSLEIFEVRMQVASYRGQSLSTMIESLLSNLNNETTPEQMWELLNGRKGTSTGMADINAFTKQLATNNIANKAAKLIITRIENYFHLMDDHNDGWEVQKDTKFIGIYENASQREHLLPQEWEPNWKTYLENSTGLRGAELSILVTETIQQIGNAFSIPDWSNASVKNSSFRDKINAYKKSHYAKNLKIFKGIDNKLTGVEFEFTPETIKKRSQEIAEIAYEIWKDPYQS